MKDAARGAYRSHFQTSARWGRFDLYHEPNFVAVRTTLPTVLTVHDLSVVTHPEWHPAERVAFHERHFFRSVSTAAHVIVVSEAVRQEAIAVLGLKPESVSAVCNGLDERFTPQPAEAVASLRQRRELPERYFLAVGTIEPRKNLLTLMRAYCDLPAMMRERCPLVLAGGWGWKTAKEFEFYETVGRSRGVRHLGYVSDPELPLLYSGAAALAYPSHYEGFGLPPVEMLACGGRVVASRIAALEEVLGPHAEYVSPNDVPAWRETLQRLVIEADDPPDARRARMAHAKSFTWQRAAAQTHAVYEHVLSQSSFAG